MTNTNYRRLLADFNQDDQLQLIREMYNRPSFFELMAKDRSETVHSAFLSWLLDGRDIQTTKEYTPLFRFLDVLLKRYNQQHTDIENKSQFERLMGSVLARSMSIEDVTVRTEVPVRELANQYEINDIPSTNDRIDLLIDARIGGITGRHNQPRINQLQIIIENKVGSSEGAPKDGESTGYNSRHQTERYYQGTFANTNMHPDLCQIYVYLTPTFSSHLDHFEDLTMDERARSPHYIQINYQDLADMIISPILQTNSLSSRTRVLLEEYMNTLTIPSYVVNDSGKRNNGKTILMAIRQNEVNPLLNIWNKYSGLIKTAIVLGTPGVSFETMSRELYFSEMQKYDFEFHPDLFKPRGGLKTFAKKDQPKFEQLCAESNDEGHTKMLLDFFAKNRNLFVAILTMLSNNTITEGELADDVDDALAALTSSLDTTKYYVSVNGKKTSSKPLTKRGVVKDVVCNLILQLEVGSVMTLFNTEFMQNAIVVSPPSDYTRYWGLDKVDGGWKAFDLTAESKKYAYYLSNQWGVSHDPVNNPGRWEKLVKFFEKSHFGISLVQA